MSFSANSTPTPSVYDDEGTYIPPPHLRDRSTTHSGRFQQDGTRLNGPDRDTSADDAPQPTRSNPPRNRTITRHKNDLSVPLVPRQRQRTIKKGAKKPRFDSNRDNPIYVHSQSPQERPQPLPIDVDRVEIDLEVSSRPQDPYASILNVYNHQLRVNEGNNAETVRDDVRSINEVTPVVNLPSNPLNGTRVESNRNAPLTPPGLVHPQHHPEAGAADNRDGTVGNGSKDKGKGAHRLKSLQAQALASPPHPKLPISLPAPQRRNYPCIPDIPTSSSTLRRWKTINPARAIVNGAETILPSSTRPSTTFPTISGRQIETAREIDGNRVGNIQGEPMDDNRDTPRPEIQQNRNASTRSSSQTNPRSLNFIVDALQRAEIERNSPFPSPYLQDSLLRSLASPTRSTAGIDARIEGNGVSIIDEVTPTHFTQTQDPKTPSVRSFEANGNVYYPNDGRHRNGDLNDAPAFSQEQTAQNSDRHIETIANHHLYTPPMIRRHHADALTQTSTVTNSLEHESGITDSQLNRVRPFIPLSPEKIIVEVDSSNSDTNQSELEYITDPCPSPLVFAQPATEGDQEPEEGETLELRYPTPAPEVPPNAPRLSFAQPATISTPPGKPNTPLPSPTSPSPFIHHQNHDDTALSLKLGLTQSEIPAESPVGTLPSALRVADVQITSQPNAATFSQMQEALSPTQETSTDTDEQDMDISSDDYDEMPVNNTTSNDTSPPDSIYNPTPAPAPTLAVQTLQPIALNTVPPPPPPNLFYPMQTPYPPHAMAHPFTHHYPPPPQPAPFLPPTYAGYPISPYPPPLPSGYLIPLSSNYPSSHNPLPSVILNGVVYPPPPSLPPFSPTLPVPNWLRSALPPVVPPTVTSSSEEPQDNTSTGSWEDLAQSVPPNLADTLSQAFEDQMDIDGDGDTSDLVSEPESEDLGTDVSSFQRSLAPTPSTVLPRDEPTEDKPALAVFEDFSLTPFSEIDINESISEDENTSLYELHYDPSRINKPTVPNGWFDTRELPTTRILSAPLYSIPEKPSYISPAEAFPCSSHINPPLPDMTGGVLLKIPPPQPIHTILGAKKPLHLLESTAPDTLDARRAIPSNPSLLKRQLDNDSGSESEGTAYSHSENNSSSSSLKRRRTQPPSPPTNTIDSLPISSVSPSQDEVPYHRALSQLNGSHFINSLSPILLHIPQLPHISPPAYSPANSQASSQASATEIEVWDSDYEEDWCSEAVRELNRNSPTTSEYARIAADPDRSETIADFIREPGTVEGHVTLNLLSCTSTDFPYARFFEFRTNEPDAYGWNGTESTKIASIGDDMTSSGRLPRYLTKAPRGHPMRTFSGGAVLGKRPNVQVHFNQLVVPGDRVAADYRTGLIRILEISDDQYGIWHHDGDTEIARQIIILCRAIQNIAPDQSDHQPSDPKWEYMHYLIKTDSTRAKREGHSCEKVIDDFSTGLDDWKMLNGPLKNKNSWHISEPFIQHYPLLEDTHIITVWHPRIIAARKMRYAANLIIRSLCQLLTSPTEYEKILEGNLDISHYFHLHCPFFRFLKPEVPLLFQGFNANCVHHGQHDVSYGSERWPAEGEWEHRKNQLLSSEQDRFLCFAAYHFHSTNRGIFANCIQHLRGSRTANEQSIAILRAEGLLDPISWNPYSYNSRVISWEPNHWLPDF
ncbi:hypothetical protein ONZ45_g14098 [Pleurotus djamor]|nr:hypothetical protein ONZ45_g14098 [Pleurotus djamor]